MRRFHIYIHLDRLVCSPLMHVVIKFLVLESRLRMHISILLWSYPVDTEKWDCQDALRLILTSVEIVFH